MKKEILLAKLVSAKSDIEAAEADLEKVIGDIRVESRASKTTISAVLEDAFTKLRAARTALVDLETIVDKDAG